MSMKEIKLIILDVDGTMTDGGVYIDNRRIETKKFSIKDGCGIVLAHAMGLDTHRQREQLRAAEGGRVEDSPCLPECGK